VKKAQDSNTSIPECKVCEYNQKQILCWFTQLCLAVQHIHTKKIIHRDIKVQNVLMMDEDNIKLGDFGIAKLLEAIGDLAHTSLGTPYYLSPEVCAGKPYDSKSDVWMLGCLLYELCTLSHPFEGPSLHVRHSLIM
jgi:NIMA (never in mitosis gene a)-related kinase